MIEKYRDMPFEERKANADHILKENPSRVPIIVACENGKLKIQKNEFLVPKQLRVVQFTATLRRSINLEPENTLYLYVKNHMLKQDRHIQEVYEQYKDSDGFLYINATDIPALGKL